MPLDPPVFPERWSMTKLSHADPCLHSLYLLLKHGSTPSHPKIRGAVAHIFAERMLWELVESGEKSLWEPQPTYDPRLDTLVYESGQEAKQRVAALTESMVDDVLRSRPDLHLPQAEADRVREMAYHIAIGWRVDPETVVAVEQSFVMDCGGRPVVGKVDVLLNEDGLLHVRDLKTSWVVPDAESFRQGFQLRLYAAAVMFGRPVEREPCAECDTQKVDPCHYCNGRGYVERLGEPLGRGANRVKVSEDYPRYLNADGEVRSQSVEVTRTEAHDFMVDLARLVDRVEQARAEDSWPAVPGSHCSICPAWTECPLAESVREAAFDPDNDGTQREQGGITSAEEAREVVQRWSFLSALRSSDGKRIRAWIKQNGPVEFGDEEIAIEIKEARETDHAALAVAAQSGQPFDLGSFRKVRASSVMKRRRKGRAA